MRSLRIALMTVLLPAAVAAAESFGELERREYLRRKGLLGKRPER